MMRSCNRGPDLLVLGRVHRRARRKERLLLFAVHAPVAFRFVSRPDADTEAMKRRRRQQRRILESSPVDRRSQHTEHAIDGRDLTAVPERRFEADDLRWFLECRGRQMSE